MEFLGLIPSGCPKCESSVKIFAMVETVISRGRCVTLDLRCVKCPWDRVRHVKLSLMTAKKTINIDTLSHNARKTAGL